jgi:hypothetical protein
MVDDLRRLEFIQQPGVELLIRHSVEQRSVRQSASILQLKLLTASLVDEHFLVGTCRCVLL